jgi:Zn-dependent metalloprotease
MKEGDPPSADPVVQQAYDGLGDTFDFYSDVFKRKSIDDRCSAMDASVHFGKAYDNAFWDGRRMIFGDGDGQLFNAFTSSLDVIAHELTHGVTQHSSSLIYFGQSGALNEHISDVFGMLVKQKKLGLTVAQSDWLIGLGLFTNNVQPVGTAALRSMKAPGTAYNGPVLGKDDQPADMAHFVHSLQDSGGVHTNSGIPNRAFYLFAKNIGVDTFAWNIPGKVWYAATQSRKMGSVMSFKKFANLTRLIAVTQFDSVVEKALVDAWTEVGIKPTAQSFSLAA